MPSPLAHSAAGYLVHHLAREKLPAASSRLGRLPVPLLIMVGLSLLPDVDAVPGLLANDLSRFHNQLTHSLPMAVLAALVVASLAARAYGSRWSAWFWPGLAAYGLHIVMDMFTGGRGAMLLWPFTTARFSAPIRLFVGVQWGQGWRSSWHLYTLATEAGFCLLIWLVVKLWPRRAAGGSGTSVGPGHARPE